MSDNSLEHVGVKGMRWGVRKSTKSFGLSRTRRMVRDRADIKVRKLEDKGKVDLPSLLDKRASGKKFAESRAEKKYVSLIQQSARMERGKFLLKDRLSALASFPYTGLVLYRKQPRDVYS